MPQRDENGNKGTFGKVLNIAGSKYMRGAAYLSSVSALKVGCGYVILCSCDEVLNTVSKLLPEAVLAPIENVSELVNEADVIEIGCGLSTNIDAKNLFEKVLKLNPKCTVLIDADGLNILSECKNIILPENLILTPHPLEASRLLKVSLNEILKDLQKSAKQISKKYNCITVLKSHNTVVCSKDLNVYVNNSGNSALAKAGSGDVLAGMISGLLAQKMTPFEACKLGVYLHGLAGEIASKNLTKYGVLATDLIRFIPNAISTILLADNI